MLYSRTLLFCTIFILISVVPIFSIQIPFIRKPHRRKSLAEDGVRFYFLSREKTTSIILTPENAIQILNQTDWNITKHTMYVIHGYVNNHKSSINVEIASAVIETSDWNVFVLDWGEIAWKFYTETKKSLKNVAEELARFIKVTNQSHDLITIVGHSLGAHVAGLASRNLNGTIQQIVALDPAGPLFEHHDPSERIQPTDGKIVHAIHTCGGFLGLMNPVGKADFYPEGGFPDLQPGCRRKNAPIKIICAHGRSYRLYGQSIRTGGIIAKKCNSYDDFCQDKCSKNKTAYLGTLKLDPRAEGTYFLKTSEKPPYTSKRI